jgi:Flp pilus assembly protein TadD
MESGRLELAEHELDRALELMPGDPETWLLVGRLRLLLAETEQEAEARAWLSDGARDAFYEAVRLDADRPEPHLELGLLAYDDGDFVTACVEFHQYLELAPRAEDSPRVRDYILELETERLCP